MFKSDLKKVCVWCLTHKPKLIVTAFLFTVILIFHRLSNDFNRLSEFSSYGSHKIKIERLRNDSRMLPNILRADYKPEYGGNSIFFVESQEKLDGVLELTTRQACSIEAAAKTNPESDVFTFFSYDVGYFNSTPLPLVDAVLSYKNVFLNYLDIAEYAEDSPLEEWLKSGRVYNSKHVIQHVSDVLRILTLWKYGGTYLDLDVVLQKKVSPIGDNFACIQKEGLINSAIVNLNGELGMSIAEENFEEVIAHFNGKLWTGNGPDVLSNIVKRICNTTDPSKMDRLNCQGFKVLPTEDCYAIDHPEWRHFFEEKYLKKVLAATKDSFAIHFWNYLSGNTKIRSNSKTAYISIANEFCPRVLAASGESF